MTAAHKARRYSTKDLVIDALCVALVLAFTMFVNLRLPIAANGGLIHLGNVALFLAAFAWAPFTFVIVGLMGYVVGLFAENWPKFWAFAASTLIALAIKLTGYYVCEGVLYGNWIAPLASVPGNIVQIVVALVITWPLAMPMRRLLRHITHYDR